MLRNTTYILYLVGGRIFDVFDSEIEGWSFQWLDTGHFHCDHLRHPTCAATAMAFCMGLLQITSQWFPTLLTLLHKLGSNRPVDRSLRWWYLPNSRSFRRSTRTDGEHSGRLLPDALGSQVCCWRPAWPFLSHKFGNRKDVRHVRYGHSNIGFQKLCKHDASDGTISQTALK